VTREFSVPFQPDLSYFQNMEHKNWNVALCESSHQNSPLRVASALATSCDYESPEFQEFLIADLSLQAFENDIHIGTWVEDDSDYLFTFRFHQRESRPGIDSTYWITQMRGACLLIAALQASLALILPKASPS
jgi:hypothetical protein